MGGFGHVAPNTCRSMQIILEYITSMTAASVSSSAVFFGPSNLDAALLDGPAMIGVLCVMRCGAYGIMVQHGPTTLGSCGKNNEKHHFKHARDAPPVEAPAEVRIVLRLHCNEQPGKDNLLEQHQAI